MMTADSTVLGGTGLRSRLSKTFDRGSTITGLKYLQVALFSKGEQGFFYDPNDLTTLYQDAAGTIPVTAAEQPVGLMLDKSKGLSLSAELFTAALDFNNWSRTVAVTSVTANSFTTNGVGGCIKNPVTFEMSAKKSYNVRIVGTCNVAHKIRSSSSSAGEVLVSAGAFDITIKSPITFSDSTLYFQLQSSGTMTVTLISIKEIAGNHAYQTVSASRPILQRNATTGAYYLAFDGSDDFLVTNSINFTAADKVSLFAGVRKLSDASVGVIAELSNNLNNNVGAFYLISPLSAGAESAAFGTKGTTSSVSIAINIVAPKSFVMRGVGNISGDVSANYINGVLGDKRNTDQGTGNYGNYPLYIGRRGGTSLPFNGHIYSLIGIGKLTTDNETATIEKELAKRLGVTLNV